MKELTLIGMGTGNPDHLTLEAIKAINAQDAILIPRKGGGKADLAELRFDICRAVLTNEETQILAFDLPVRDEATASYKTRVDDWHDEIALVWAETMRQAPDVQRIALLVWGDPSLYDSTLRIARRLDPVPKITVIPGLTSLQVLTAAHAIPLNDIGAPFTVTTGRQLRDHAWPEGASRVAVMLDGSCAFQELDPEGLHIWWGGFVGMPQQIICEGPLAEVGPQIIDLRAKARADHGWIMDIYLLSRS